MVSALGFHPRPQSPNQLISFSDSPLGYNRDQTAGQKLLKTVHRGMRHEEAWCQDGEWEKLWRNVCSGHLLHEGFFIHSLD